MRTLFAVDTEGLEASSLPSRRIPIFVWNDRIKPFQDNQVTRVSPISLPVALASLMQRPIDLSAS